MESEICLGDYLVVYDAGTGAGLRSLVRADSAEQIRRRFPQVCVVTVGDPEWVTSQEYERIIASLVPIEERCNVSHPTGWLARLGSYT